MFSLVEYKLFFFMASFPVSEIRKIIPLNQIKPGIYSGLIIGYVATFVISGEYFEVNMTTGFKNRRCQLHVQRDNTLTIETTD